MFRTIAGHAVRGALIVSMAAYGIAPAAAAIPRVDRGNSTETSADLLPELEIILAALRDGPARQTVDHPKPDRNRDKPSRPREAKQDRDPRRIDEPLTRIMTQKIVQDVNSVRKECGQDNDVYRIDCLRQGIQMVAASLPDNSEYREAKRILTKASGRLGRIVATHQDRSVPKLEVPADANPRFKKRRKYTAIKREAVQTAMTEASEVVNEAATELLRSGENSERRYAHYQDISVAVDSTKILLRSG